MNTIFSGLTSVLIAFLIIFGLFIIVYLPYLILFLLVIAVLGAWLTGNLPKNTTEEQVQEQVHTSQPSTPTYEPNINNLQPYVASISEQGLPDEHVIDAYERCILKSGQRKHKGRAREIAAAMHYFGPYNKHYFTNK